MNQPIKTVAWPVVYVDTGLDEELMLVTNADWHHDVDVQYVIGPIKNDNHFFVDSSSEVFPLFQDFESNYGFPVILLGEKLSDPKREDILKLVLTRARRWSKIDTNSVSCVIERLK